MPILDMHKYFGLELDRGLTNQSTNQPLKIAARCFAFEKEWVECADGIGQTRAKRECQIEYEDFMECMHRTKSHTRLEMILEQRAKLMKEGKYTPPPYHTGQKDNRP